MRNAIKKLAINRFYTFISEKETYKYCVLDREKTPKTIAKFKEKDDANFFLQEVIERFVDEFFESGFFKSLREFLPMCGAGEGANEQFVKKFENLRDELETAINESEEEDEEELIKKCIQELICLNCGEELLESDADPNGTMDVTCAKCKAEEAHDYDKEPNALFARDGKMIPALKS